MSLFLLNCRHCDDVVKLLDLRERTCECGKSSGRLVADKPTTSGTYARVFAISWEHYDSARPNEPFTWTVVP